MLVGPSWIFFSTGSPLASSSAAIICPSSAPSVSIFDATTIAPAALAGAAGNNKAAATTAVARALPILSNGARFPGGRWARRHCAGKVSQLSTYQSPSPAPREREGPSRSDGRVRVFRLRLPSPASGLRPEAPSPAVRERG